MNSDVIFDIIAVIAFVLGAAAFVTALAQRHNRKK
jgi:hypothetical protein